MGIRVRNPKEKSQCRLCGRQVVWAMNDATGKWIPLDPMVHVYDHYEEKDPTTGRMVRKVNPAFDNAASDHRSTCPAGKYNRALKPPTQEVRHDQAARGDGGTSPANGTAPYRPVGGPAGRRLQDDDGGQGVRRDRAQFRAG